MSAAPHTVLRTFDHAGLRLARRALGGTPAVPAARAMSHFGEHALGWIVVGSAGWLVADRRGPWGESVVGAVAAHAAGVLVKRAVRRPRPTLVDVPSLVATHSRLSFPSAHSCSTAAALVGLAPVVGTPVAAGVITTMLVSRVLLGVHYPSDVLAGAGVGVGVGLLVRRTARRRRGGAS